MGAAYADSAVKESQVRESQIQPINGVKEGHFSEYKGHKSKSKRNSQGKPKLKLSLPKASYSTDHTFFGVNVKKKYTVSQRALLKRRTQAEERNRKKSQPTAEQLKLKTHNILK